MTYIEGFAVAQKYGLEAEFDYSYNHSTLEDEEDKVLDALSEWDIL